MSEERRHTIVPLILADLLGGRIPRNHSYGTTTPVSSYGEELDAGSVTARRCCGMFQMYGTRDVTGPRARPFPVCMRGRLS